MGYPCDHARRKFYELHANHQSQLAEQARALDYSLKRWVALTRLPAQRQSEIGEILPHRWVPAV